MKKKREPKHPLIVFIEHLPVMAIKGFVFFLGSGLILIITGGIESLFPPDGFPLFAQLVKV